MASQLQLRRGTTVQHGPFIGAPAEVTVDTDKKTVVVHDGSTPGGFPSATAAELAAGLATKVSVGAAAGGALSGTYPNPGLNISGLADATTVNAADQLIIDQGGVTKRATATELLSGTATVTATGATVGRSLKDRFADWVCLEDFGAIDDGVTDCSAAFAAAIASGIKVIYAPGQDYYFASGITIPQNIALIGGSVMPTNPQAGTRFTFPATTAVCVTMGGDAATNGSGRLANVTIRRAAGAIPAGSIGLLVKRLYAAVVEDVCVFRHAIGIQASGDNNVYGITYIFTRTFTGAITDAHFVQEVPECRFNQCRFGMVGPSDQNCNAYVRIQGGSTTNPPWGPNTFVATNCQFNQGTNLVTSLFEFVNQTSGSVADHTVWQLDTCYVETCTHGIKSDASWPSITRLHINNCNFNMAGQFLNLNAATTINSWTIDNCWFAAPWTIAPSSQINFGQINNCDFWGAGSSVSLTGVGSSTMSVSDCNFGGGLTLAGAWGNLQVTGSLSGGSLSNTATGSVNVDIGPFNTQQTFTPSLEFGGASSGITYAYRGGAYVREGRRVEGQVRVQLTNKGSSAGGAAIQLTGLPAMASDGFSVGNSGGSAYALNMSGLGTSPITAIVGSGPRLLLYIHSATGIDDIDNTNFTNTSDIAVSFSYIAAS